MDWNLAFIRWWMSCCAISLWLQLPLLRNCLNRKIVYCSTDNQQIYWAVYSKSIVSLLCRHLIMSHHVTELMYKRRGSGCHRRPRISQKKWLPSKSPAQLLPRNIPLSLCSCRFLFISWFEGSLLLPISDRNWRKISLPSDPGLFWQIDIIPSILSRLIRVRDLSIPSCVPKTVPIDCLRTTLAFIKSAHRNHNKLFQHNSASCCSFALCRRLVGLMKTMCFEFY